MSISTKAELRTAICNWSEWDSDLNARAEEFIALAETDIIQDLMRPDVSGAVGVNQLLVTATGTLTQGSAALAHPADFLGVKTFYLTVAAESVPLVYKTADELERAYPSDAISQPAAYTSLADAFRIKPIPDAPYAYTLVHWAAPSTVTASDTATNWILQQFPAAYLYGSLTQAAPFLELGGASNAKTWDTLYSRAIGRMKSQSALISFPQTNLQIQLGGVTIV